MAEKDFELWEENAEPLGIFLKLQTQWRRSGGRAVGMDYAGVRAALDLMGKQPAPGFFEQLQTMERAALDALRKAD